MSSRFDVATGVTRPPFADADPVTSNDGLGPDAGTVPVTVAVQVNVFDAPAARLNEAGLGALNAPMAAESYVTRVSADGVTLLTELPVLLVTVILKVAVSPENRHDGVIAMLAFKGLTVRILERAIGDVAVFAPLRAAAVN
jgi:hypothetical protein